MTQAVDVDKNYKSELKGKPGLGYFLDIAIGSPQQKVRFCSYLFSMNIFLLAVEMRQ